MRLAIPLILLFVAIAADFALATHFGVYQRYPWIHILATVVASSWLAFEGYRRFREGWKKSITAVLATLVAVFFTLVYAWYVLDYSSYPSTEATVVGNTVVELASLHLDNQRGEATPVLDDGPSERKTLIVLYRGYW